MPYIVTTHRHLDDPTGEFMPGAKPGVSRRAVATLDEARKWVANEIADLAANTGRTYPPLDRQYRNLTEQGGTVGPLPDGTVIEVERVGWSVLREATDGYGEAGIDPRPTETVIAAYNAAQEKGE